MNMPLYYVYICADCLVCKLRLYYTLCVINAEYLKHYFLNRSGKHLHRSLFSHRCSMILFSAGSSARLLQNPAWLFEATKIWQYVQVHWIYSSLNCICLWDGNMGMWSLLLPVTACRQDKLRMIHTKHAVPMPCRDPALLRQCHVLCESLRGSRKYLNC
jgi:hypothetical protein